MGEMGERDSETGSSEKGGERGRKGERKKATFVLATVHSTLRTAYRHTAHSTQAHRHTGIQGIPGTQAHSINVSSSLSSHLFTQGRAPKAPS